MDKRTRKDFTEINYHDLLFIQPIVTYTLVAKQRPVNKHSFNAICSQAHRQHVIISICTSIFSK
jgi:hypothetical protein